MNRQLTLGVCLALGTMLGHLSPLRGQGTAFNYQGRLNDSGGPAAGTYDLRFTIFDSTNVPGKITAGPLTNSATVVTNGLFCVSIDFGAGVFTGAGAFMQVDVRTNGAATFTTLWPRQPIQAVPYAIMANSASNLLGTLPATQLTGTIPTGLLPGAVLTNGQNSALLNGTFTGSGAGLSNLNASQITGTLPAGVLPGGVIKNFGIVTNLIIVGDTANGHGAISNIVTDIYNESGYGSYGAGWLWVLEGRDSSGNLFPMVSMGNDYGGPNADTFITSWGNDQLGDLNANAGRFFGNMVEWQQASPGADTRSIILKGFVQNPNSMSEGAGSIFETHASSGSYGNHGIFNNPWLVVPKGPIALGNLTDASDAGGNTNFENWLDRNGGWVTIIPGGSSWSGSSAQIPGLVLVSQALATTIIPGAIENPGSALYFTDGNSVRHKLLQTGTGINQNISIQTNSAGPHGIILQFGDGVVTNTSLY